MATSKLKKVYLCSECGYETSKWVGKCPDCGSWNTMPEEGKSAAPLKTNAGYCAAPAAVSLLSEVVSGEEIRYVTGIDEIDRVLGGGVVPGAAVLISGDPGIGKSTILLQMCRPLCEKLKILYVSGEESARQIKLRALRLGVTGENLLLLPANDLGQVLGTVAEIRPDLLIIDSIQTMNCAELASAPGSVTQIRECAQQLIRTAKEKEIPLFLVGHVNKDGVIAGPKILEHMVDTVLYFEGDRHLPYRILRAMKNRFGSTNEIGVFEMLESGLTQVENPSMMLLSGRPENVSGTCVTCVLEGSRPLLAEVQALVSKSAYPVPKRTANGLDFNRAAMLLAVLDKRSGYPFAALDAYINVVGGLRLDEPAVDLALAFSLVSNLTDTPIRDSIAVFGEIGLAGEIRTVGRAQARVSEAYRLGFRTVVLPKQNAAQIKTGQMPELTLVPLRSVTEIGTVLGTGGSRR